MPGMHITLNFEEKGKTTVTSTSTFPTEGAAQQAIDMGVEQGMNSTLNQLEKLLNKSDIHLDRIPNQRNVKNLSESLHFDEMS